MTTQQLDATTITDDQIRALRDNAAAAGDTLQVALCNHALEDADGTLTDEDGRPDMTATSVAMARQDCANAINGARAQEGT